MNKLTIKELKEKLQEIIETLEEYDESMEIEPVSNTYFLHGSNYWMQFGSLGFIDLEDIDSMLNNSDEDEEDDNE